MAFGNLVSCTPRDAAPVREGFRSRPVDRTGDLRVADHVAEAASYVGARHRCYLIMSAEAATARASSEPCPTVHGRATERPRFGDGQRVGRPTSATQFGSSIACPRRCQPSPGPERREGTALVGRSRGGLLADAAGLRLFDIRLNIFVKQEPLATEAPRGMRHLLHVPQMGGVAFFD
jgi:hypothetical protein